MVNGSAARNAGGISEKQNSVRPAIKEDGCVEMTKVC